MSVTAAQVEFRYSGGAANTDPNLALGGAISTAGGGVVDDNILHDLWDALTPGELASDTEYRGIYIKNSNGTDAFEAARCYLTQPVASGHELDIALAAEAVNVAMATIANESTAPSGPVFSRPTTYAGGLQLNSATGLVGSAFKGLWIRRTATSAVSGTITGTLTAEGTTL